MIRLEILNISWGRYFKWVIVETKINIRLNSIQYFLKDKTLCKSLSIKCIYAADLQDHYSFAFLLSSHDKQTNG